MVQLHSFVTLCSGDRRCSARVVAIDDDEVTLCADQELPARAGDVVTLVPLDASAAPVRARVEWACETDALVALVEPATERPSVRRGVRVPVDEPTELTLLDRAETVRKRTRARIVDLSANGCALAVATDLAIGSRVRLGVRLAGRDVELAGTVVRHERLDDLRTRAAVRLDAPAEAAKRAIAACIRARTHRAFETV